MWDVKVQQLRLQASVDAPVNRAEDRCEPGAGRTPPGASVGKWASHGPGSRHPRRCPVWGGGVWWRRGALSGRDCKEGGLCPGGPCFLHPVLFRKRFLGTERGCRAHVCPASPLCVLQAHQAALSHPSGEARNGASLLCTKASPPQVRISCNSRASQQTLSLMEMLLQNPKSCL